MELGYDTLWKACTWFLLSFLVTWLVSLLVSFSSCDSASGSVKDNGFAVDDDHDYEQRKKIKKKQRGGVVGDGLMGYNSGSERKRVKFDDQPATVVEFEPVVEEDVYVRDVEVDLGEVNVVHDDLVEKVVKDVVSEELVYEESNKLLVNVGSNEGFDDYGESGGVVKELVDQIEKGKEFVGLENEVGGELGGSVNGVDLSYKIAYCEEKDRIRDLTKESSVEFGDIDGHGNVVGLGDDKVVDDGSRIEGVSLSIDNKREESCQELDRNDGVWCDDERIVDFVKREGQGSELGWGLGGEKAVYGDDRSLQVRSSYVHEGEKSCKEYYKDEEMTSSNVHKGDSESGRDEQMLADDESIVDSGDREGHGSDIGLASDKVVNIDLQSEEVSSSNAPQEEKSGQEFDRDEGMLGDDEDWEGIERSDLEKTFARAVNYVECQETHERLAKVGSDVMMQLYGLQKIAMEGPCHEPQPMALKLSARAKWNAWQRLGNMTPEKAMEHYVNLLLNNDPEWKQDLSLDKD